MFMSYCPGFLPEKLNVRGKWGRGERGGMKMSANVTGANILADGGGA